MSLFQQKHLWVSRIALSILSGIPVIYGATIVSVTGDSAGGGSSLGGSLSQVLLTSWSSVDAYSDVTVTAVLGTFDATSTGTVFLMSMIGHGATTANQIAAGNYSVNSADSADVILFSGLELAPGTYYLVLTGPTTSNAFWRQTLAPPTIVTAAGVP